MAPEIIFQPSYIIDRLYGRIEITPDDLKLFQTKEMARTRGVSLSSQPPHMLNAGMCDTRFNHSIGVAHLAKIVGRKGEFQDIARDLYYAALCHDAGHPPFSHSSDYFLGKILGKNHEEMVSETLDGSELGKEIVRQGGSIDTITKLIQGKLPPYSDLLNGTIDIDNLDNILRYVLGIGLLKNPLYSPEKIANSFSVKDSSLIFLAGIEEDLKGWAVARKTVYDYVDGPINKSIAMMIFRGLGFAQDIGELEADFFFMTDAEALDYLSNRCNPRTQDLFRSIDRWIFHQQVYEFLTTSPDQNTKKLLENRDNRIALADEISQKLNIKPENICVYVGKSKGTRQIHIPTLDQAGNGILHQPEGVQKWMADVYVHPDYINKAQKIREFMRSKLS